MERFFNTAGPPNLAEHYVLDPLLRWNLPEVLTLISQRKYFLLHAPRQTGKTTCLLALCDYLNQQGDMHCVYINVEEAQASVEDMAEGIRAMLDALAQQCEWTLQDDFVTQHWQQHLSVSGPMRAFGRVVSAWCHHSSKPIVLLIDEADALVGKTLISLLRQLRAGYISRTKIPFAHSVVLCGLRDIRDYRVNPEDRVELQRLAAAGSPFNVKSNSLRLGDFSQQDIQTLYAQHTQETAQQFAAGVCERVFELTQGQPWLVNALAYEACFCDKAGLDRSKTITLEAIDIAKEKLIQRRETHLDQLMAKLKQDRVQRVIESMLLGVEQPISPNDVEYVSDLGLIRCEPNGDMDIANPIYREVIPRQLSYRHQLGLQRRQADYVTPQGALDITKLLQAFQQFFRENSDSWLGQFQYQEAGPHLILQAFLQRIINGGGSIDREYALGRGRTDLLVTWPKERAAQANIPIQRIVLELKLVRAKDGHATKLQEGIEQTGQYMDRCAATAGHLLLFDRRAGKSWDERIWVKQEQSSTGQAITVWGL